MVQTRGASVSLGRNHYLRPWHERLPLDGSLPCVRLVNLYRTKAVSVVVPAYNESTLITSTLEAIPDFVDTVYVVDDGSTDDTASKVMGICSPRIRLIQHKRNVGVGAAILTGYNRAFKDGSDIVAVMAGDNQMDPSQLSRLFDPLIDGHADYSKGNRLAMLAGANGMSGWRRFGNTVLSILTKIASGYWHISDSQNGYTAISRFAFKAIENEPLYDGYGYCNDILIKLSAHGTRVVDVHMPARYGEEVSKIRYGRYIVKVSNLLLKGFIWRNRRRVKEGMPIPVESRDV